MNKDMIVSTNALETRIAILEDDQLAEIYIERYQHRGILGNIYKGKVTKVLPGMQSAFVQIGLEKDAFLYVSDFIEGTDEYEKVLDDEPVPASADTEVAAPERRPRRERRGERSRSRDRRDRSSTRPVPAAAGQNGEQESVLEQWTLSAESASRLEAAVPSLEGTAASEIPRPQEPTDNVGAGSGQPAESPGTGAGEPDTLDSASLRNRDDVLPFATKSGRGGGGLSARRRGSGARRRRYTTARHSKRAEKQSIDDMLREGQEILVQVAKEPIARKGARVTSHIALPGRYLVYMPTVDHVGVSRKIGTDAERSRLRDIILKQRHQFQGGIIVRTAAEERSEEDIVSDLNYLVKLWDDIRSRAEKVSAPALIHSELNLVQRLLRDQFSFEFTGIWVDDEVEYQKIVEFVDKIFPNLVGRVKLFTKSRDIFEEFGITPEIEKLLQPKIWLKSGGYIVINQTEALVSIDINTGKFVGRGNSLEETITRTNLDAVKEIVKQLRLRDLGGIIVIDFIDMDERKNRKRVMDALSEELHRDKAPSKILEFNEFGLVAITRKRVKQSLERTLCQPCLYCHGSGMVKSAATTCYSIYHEIEKMSKSIDGRGEIMLRVHPEVARSLRESESAVLEEMRNFCRRDIIVKPDPNLHIENFNIVT